MCQSPNTTQVSAADRHYDSCDAPTTSQAGLLLGALVVLLGLGGLVCDFLQVRQYGIVNIHLLFGVVLLAAVARSLLGAWPALQKPGAGNFYFHTRYLARWVYGLLYFMAGVRLCLYLVGNHEAGKGWEAFDWVATPDRLRDFQLYIGFGLLAVCLIRLCAMVTLARASAREME